MKRSIRNEVNCPSYLDPRKGERKMQKREFAARVKSNSGL